MRTKQKPDMIEMSTKTTQGNHFGFSSKDFSPMQPLAGGLVFCGHLKSEDPMFEKSRTATDPPKRLVLHLGKCRGRDAGVEKV